MVVEDTGVGDVKAEKARAAVQNTLKLLSRVPEITAGFADTVEKNVNGATDLCRQKSWDLLSLHLEYCNRLAKFRTEALLGNFEEAKSLLTDLINDLFTIEDSIHPQLDIVLFRQFCSSMIPKEKR